MKGNLPETRLNFCERHRVAYGDGVHDACGLCTDVPAPKNKGGRPRKADVVAAATSSERLLEIIARVARGETLTAICKEPGFPVPVTFRAAIARDRDLASAWEAAKQERPHTLFEEAIDIARELRDRDWGKEDANKVRALQVAIEGLRTAAARLAPREYGERAPTQVVVPVQINTSLGLDPGSTSVGPKKSIYTIEASISEDTP